MTASRTPRRYPSGLGGTLPTRQGRDVHTWLAATLLSDEERPVGECAPCMNPECTGPVDHVPGVRPRLYCTPSCRSRAARLRSDALQQLDVLEELLAATKATPSIDRDRLHQRAQRIRWWLTRLTPAEPE